MEERRAAHTLKYSGKALQAQGGESSMRGSADQMYLVRALHVAAALAEVDDPHLGASDEGLRGIGRSHAKGGWAGPALSQLGLALHARCDGLDHDQLLEENGFGTWDGAVRAASEAAHEEEGGEEGREDDDGDQDY